MKAVFRKEMADYFTSIRVLILFLLTLFISGLALFAAYKGIRGTGSEQFVFLRLFTTELPDFPFAFLLTFVNFVALFFIPIIGITLGFDAVNREHSEGTLGRILSQPIFRDSVINAKFLAGIATLSIMMTTAILIVSGLGLRMIGVPPSSEEIIRLFIYLVVAIVYGAFWIGLAILFSVLFRSIATSLLSALALWILFSFGVFVLALVMAENAQLSQTLMQLSPNLVFGQATAALLYPTVRTLGTITIGQAVFMIPNPLSLSQSLLLVWPHLTSLISLTLICFGISYVVFMRQEIRTA